jgi:hypothetical protein
MLAEIGFGPAEESIRVFRIELNRLIVIGDGSIEIALCLIEGTPIDVR